MPKGITDIEDKDKYESEGVPPIEEELPPVETSALYIKNRALRTYAKLTGTEKPAPTVSPVKAYKAPSEEDYEKGYYRRYFIARYDAAVAIEVTEDFYNNEFGKMAPGLYKKKAFTWYINDKKLPNLKGLKASVSPKSVNEYNTYLNARKLPQLEKTIEDFEKYVR